MDLSDILSFVGHSVYAPQIDALFKRCNASCGDKAELDLYDSVKSESLGVELWFWWKGYYREQIAEPQNTIERADSKEVVFYEVRLTPPGLADSALPFGLSFPATSESVVAAMGRKPFSKTKNFFGEAVWTYYEDAFELLVIFDKSAEQVRCFKIIAMGRDMRKKIDLLENLQEQKQNILPERIGDIQEFIDQSPTVLWENRMKSGDSQITASALEDSREIFVAFIAGVCKATKTRNAKSIYAAVKKATKAFNKVARQHPGFIETLEREEIVSFLIETVQLTGFQIDPTFDLTEEYRSW